MPIIIIGGIVSGIFTATESGVIAVVYAIVIGMFVYKEITIKDFWPILLQTAKTTATIIFLIGAASLFIWFLSFNSIPNQLLNMLGPVADNPILLLLLINVILLIAGTFIDTISAVSIFYTVILAACIGGGHRSNPFRDNLIRKLDDWNGDTTTWRLLICYVFHCENYRSEDVQVFIPASGCAYTRVDSCYVCTRVDSISS